MSDTPRLGLPLVEAAQAQKHVTHNEALRILDSLVQAVAVDRTRTAPPPSPAEGDVHLVAPAATGGWSGHDLDLAVRLDGAWSFLTPRIGWIVWIAAESAAVVWTGVLWRLLPEAIGTFAGLAGLGIGTAPDTTNRLAVRSPAALFAAEATSGGGSGDVRLTLEKEAAGRTASLLFQSNWSGRAEIGLTGDDDLRLKVSPDGAAWIDALRIVAATGQMILGTGLAGGGRLRSMNWMTASGTWTRPTGIRWVLVFAVGGGGGGGGAGGAAASGAAGGGGGAGGLAISLLDVSEIASRTVTIGAGGSAGSSAGGNAGPGGSSSFGSEVVAGGGSGSSGMAAGTTAASAVGGVGGTATAGDVLCTGTPGLAGLRLDGTNTIAGAGGASFFGGGGRGAVANVAGSAGTARGSGGSGGVVSASATGRVGGTGAAGVVWVWEFE